MDLPNLFSHKQTPDQDTYLSLLLTDQSAQSALWRAADQKIILLNKSGVRYFGNEDERLIQVDESLRDLGEDSEDKNLVLLGLEPNWVNKQGIIPAKKKELKKITDKLELKAVGFVLTTESLRHYLVQHNQYLSSVLLYIGAHFLELVIIRQGQLEQTLSVGRSDDIVSDLKEALARLDQKPQNNKKLPPNLVLSSAVLDEEKLQNYRQQLLEQDWQDELNFIQAPVIDLISHDKLLTIVTRQGGQAVAQANGLLVDQKGSLDALDHHQGKSVATQLEPEQHEQEPANKLSSFGVAVKQDVVGSDNLKAVPEQQTRQPIVKRKSMKSTAKKNDQSAVGSKEVSRFQQKQSVHSSRKKTVDYKVIAIVAVVAGLIATAAIGFFYLKANYVAQILVIPALRSINQDVVITLDPNATQTDAASNILKANVVNKEVTGNDQRQTTGVKLVGEEATGTIDLYNKTNEEKTFTGDVVFASGDLTFVLNEEVTVPAATVEENDSGDGEVKEYGQIETTLTAVEIGADSNISENTELQVADFAEDTYSAKAISDFTGGSSREIRVVSEADREELLVSLRQNLLKQARDEFEADSNNGVYLNPTNNYRIVNQNYSHEVGDEVEQLSLDLTISSEAISYTSGDLKLLAQEVLESQVPEGYKLLDQTPEIVSQPVEEEQTGDRIKLEANLSGQVEAVINVKQLQQDVAGMLITQAQTNLKANEKVNQVKIELNPGISHLIFKQLPNDSGRLMITMDSP